MSSSWRRIPGRLRERARRWARRRQGSDPAQLTLTTDRVYILPTMPGLLYGVMLVVMLAGAMNYNNNLAFALTFMLAGTGVAGIYHTHRILAGLRIHYLGAAPVFAGETLQVRFSLLNDTPMPREEIFLDWAGNPALPGGVDAHETRTVSMPLATVRRGKAPLPRLRLTTCAPLGLMRAWAWVHLEPRPLVYARPAAADPLCRPPDSALPDGGRQLQGEEDFAGFRNWQPADSPRRIAWRRYARSGELVVADYRGGQADDCLWLDWDQVSGDADTRASGLTRLVLDAYAAQASWGLRLPGLQLDPEQGGDHLHRCLACLATVQAVEQAD